VLGVRGEIIVDNTHSLVVERSYSINYFTNCLSKLASLQIGHNKLGYFCN